MQTVIETRTVEFVIRLSKTDQAVFIIEKWILKQQRWQQLMTNPDFWTVLHAYLDELCRVASPSSTLEELVSTRKRVKVDPREKF